MFRAEEDYIKLIYTLTVEVKKDRVKTGELVKNLNHSKQTVIEMIRKLESKGFLEYTPYQGVRLSKLGKGEALRILRAHRLWEVFLTEKLGFDWDDVHHDAELLEHASSEEIINRLYLYLNEPSFCQHGNPIPDNEGNVLDVLVTSLDEFDYPGKFKIIRVLDETEILEFLKTSNLKIGDVLEISKLDINNNLLISNSKSIYINKYIASSIFGNRI